MPRNQVVGADTGARQKSHTRAERLARCSSTLSLGAATRMTQTKAKLQGSTVAGLIALAFFGALFCTSLATPAAWFYLIYGGIGVSSAVAIYRWRLERRRDANSSSAGLWIVVAIVLLFLLLCVILPGI